MSQLDDVLICNHDTAELIAQNDATRHGGPYGPSQPHDHQSAQATATADISSEDDPMAASSTIRLVQPIDRCNIIYISLLLAGIGFLLPYNSFITAVDYFLDKYPGSTIVFDMSLTYIIVAFVAVFLNNALVESFSLHTRVTFGYIVAFMALSLVAIFDVGLEVFSPGTSYFAILVAVAVVSLGCTGAAGLLTSINRIITKLLVHDVKTNTLTFFVLSAAMVLVCLVTHHLARRTNFVRFYMAACSRENGEEDCRGLTRYDQLSDENGSSSECRSEIQSPSSDANRHRERSLTGARTPSIGVLGEENSFEIECPEVKAYERFLCKARALKRGLQMRRDIALTLWPYMLSIALAYFVTLCLFPGIESEVVSCALNDWMPVVMMAIFNAADFCGKIIGAIPYDWSARALVIAESLRLAIIPLMVLCVAPRYQPVLSHRGWAMTFSGVLGITNGYFGSVPMIMAPAKVSENKKELAGNIMTLSYNVGLTTGSATAYLLNYLLGATSAASCITPVMANISHVPGRPD